MRIWNVNNLWLAVMLCGLLALPGTLVAAADDLELLEQKALTAAVERVAPSVVRIETIGGLERVERVLFGLGPTTGLIVDPQGYIVSSAFNFVNKPASILVRLPDGTRKPAKLVATDHNRKIVLLKIDAGRPLPVPETAPEDQMRVGQWCVAVGKTFDDNEPNLAVGMLSALGRIWGKAIQTDAAVSPNNYGGPLVDIRGRVLGILVPLSPQSADEIAGIEWYDSGIGFAIPLASIQKVLPKLRSGTDLHPGVVGVQLQATNMYMGNAEIASCRPKSPAARAGFKAGDRIVEIDGLKISRAAQVKQEISRRYAGDTMHVVVLRGGQRIEHDVELVAKLPPHQHGFLGILPRRGNSDRPGVTVRYVYPHSPAAAAKIEPDDAIVSLAGKALKTRDDLIHGLSALEPGQEAELEIRHGSQTRKEKLTLAELPEDLPPAALPPARPDAKPAAAFSLAELEKLFRFLPGHGPRVGLVPLRVAEFTNRAWAYVPEACGPAVPCGLVVWLHGSAPIEQKDLLARWKPLCDRHDLVLLVPTAAEGTTWQADEAAYVAALIHQVQSGYAIDPTRVVVFGRDSGASLAYLLGFRSRDLVRAVAVIDAGSTLPPPESDPRHRLAVYLATAKNPRQPGFMTIALRRLREMKVPLTQKDLGADPRDLTLDELAELARWIDMLDRI